MKLYNVGLFCWQSYLGTEFLGVRKNTKNTNMKDITEPRWDE